MQYKTLFFDLDGTLTDSAPGITETTRRTLHHYGIEEKAERLLRFIGPPLSAAFREYYGFSPEKTKEAVAYWREIYFREELWKSTPFAGVRELLEALRLRGYRLCIATSKPQILADMVLENAGLSAYFDLVIGATLDDSRNDKTSVLRYAIEKSGAPKADCLMIGDRVHDARGAAENGIAFLGVLYGYGNREEFENSVFIAENVSSILQFLK